MNVPNGCPAWWSVCVGMYECAQRSVHCMQTCIHYLLHTDDINWSVSFHSHSIIASGETCVAYVFRKALQV